MKQVKRKAIIIPVPSELSHFTTVDGLRGIIKTKSLWASNVSFLNDRRELQHGINAAERVLEDFAVTQRPNVAKVVRDVIAEIKQTKLPDTYATCFCQSSDLLSQWRGYSGRTQGVSLTFNGSLLRTMFKRHGGSPMAVVYDKERTVERVRRTVVTLSGLADLSKGTDDAETIKANLLRRLPRLIPRFKDDGFSEEDEWRFVIQKENDFDGVQFRESDGVIVPYLLISAISKLPLRRVTVGPGKNQELTIRSIELFLSAHNYDNVVVEPSAVPYRN